MSQQEILNKVAKGEITADEASVLLTKANEKPITFKVGEKGGVSVYGLGRFPTTLYAGQWSRLLDNADAIRQFIDENKHRLASKEVA